MQKRHCVCTFWYPLLAPRGWKMCAFSARVCVWLSSSTKYIHLNSGRKSITSFDYNPPKLSGNDFLKRSRRRCAKYRGRREPYIATKFDLARSRWKTKRPGPIILHGHGVRCPGSFGEAPRTLLRLAARDDRISRRSARRGRKPWGCAVPPSFSPSSVRRARPLCNYPLSRNFL